MRLFATCARGLEDVSAAEVADLAGACATPDRDKVFFAARWGQVCQLSVRARTLHKLHLLLAREPVQTVEDVARASRGVDWPSHLPEGRTFGVKPSRHGRHAFTSLDIGRVVGQEVQRVVEAGGRARPRVHLDAPDVEVTALLRDEELVLGLNLTGESLHKRGYRVAQHPAPLRPTLAAALLRWAGYRPEQGLWDPMCGSGTIPIEAAMLARRVPPNPARPFLMERLAGFPADELAAARAGALAEATQERWPILGTERFPSHLERAAANARAAGVLDTVTLRQLDATRARRDDLPFAPGLVVVNPPYGLRIASKAEVQRLVRGFLARVAELAPPRLVVLSGTRWFGDAARERGMAPAEAREVLYGQLVARAMRFDLAPRELPVQPGLSQG